MRRFSTSMVLLLVLALLWSSAGATGRLTTPAEVSSWLLAATADGGRADFLVVLKEQGDLSAAYQLPDKQARGRYVYQQLWETAERTQAPLRGWLEARGVPYRPYYIVNLVHVLQGDRALLEALAGRPEVGRIEANPQLRHILPADEASPAAAAPQAVEWNIARVNADDVWALGYTGQGIVVGGQDTGYDWDHPALKYQYRGWDGATASHDYNWHDAIYTNTHGTNVCGANSPEPCDDTDHGTHTMGTAVGYDGGSNQIGMAPGAKWIGCRNMDNGWGTPTTYLECFEFFLAPYPVGGTPAQGSPDLAPDVTNNSWTCPASEGCSWGTLQAAVEAQRAAGIMTVASAGNTGSACSSVYNPPALYDASYSIGATDSGDNLVSFSARGPVTVDGSGRLKPDLVAPGSSVRSSLPGTGYGYKSGTSMASPHVAGAVALLWSAVPSLTNQITATEELLNQSALHIASTLCSSSGVPNNLYGWGRLDVLAAAEGAAQVCQPVEGADFGFQPAEPLSGQAVLFTGAVLTGTLPVTYSWDFGDGSAAQVGNPISHTFLLTAPAGYTVTLTAANPCPSQAVARRAVFIRPVSLFLPLAVR